MNDNLENPEAKQTALANLARVVLVSFLLTFILARLVVFLTVLQKIPDLYLYIRGIHIHHLNYGIFILSAVGAYLLFKKPVGNELKIIACFYGIGLALTFDEFGMWLHLGGSYWQRASWDAITVLAAILVLIAFAPSLKSFRLRHWLTVLVIAFLAIIFFVMLIVSLRFAWQKMGS